MQSPFHYKWYLNSENIVDYHKSTVFSCFSGAGGSSMGYKLAGYNLLGCLEIDKKMFDLYTVNLKPKYAFNTPIKKFKKSKNIPKDLFNLDILDGSPPCSSFSMSGKRDKFWGKAKKFREGQYDQILDRLFFDFIDLANILKPKIIIAENVPGILYGKAAKYRTNYVHDILKAFKKINYTPQYFILNAQYMGVPQKRQRVFFIAMRNDLINEFSYQKTFFQKIPKLDLKFNYDQIKFKEFRSKEGYDYSHTERGQLLAKYKIKSDHKINDINQRVNKKLSGFNASICHDEEVLPTITASGRSYRYIDNMGLSNTDYILGQTFPINYEFINNNIDNIKYVCGMSVPPVMMANLSYEIYKQWLIKINKNESK